MSSKGRRAFSVAATSVWIYLADYDNLRPRARFWSPVEDILVCTLLGTTYRAHYRYYDYALYKFSLYSLTCFTYLLGLSLLC